MLKTFYRRWFRFSLRTLFVVMTLLCCWLGWESSVVRRRQALRRELQENATFQFTTAAQWVGRYPPGSPVPPVATIPLVRRWLGDEAIQEVWFIRHYQGFDERQLARVTEVFPEAELSESLPDPCHPGCFPSGTLVDTPQGPRRIESIEPGDALTAFLASGEPVTALVQSVFTTQNRLWQIETDAGLLMTTETQPLCLAIDRIVPAGELEPGDTILHRHDKEIRSARVLTASATDRTEQVFNLVLGDSELFIAGGFLARSKPPVEAAGR
ncbi:MAG: hypothetical protein WD872_07335 [Pirellulaceae bacterium]